MDLRRFITLKTVVEEGSFLRASQKLCCTQSTVTFHIQQLEQEFSVQLFEKIGRRMCLTREGKKLLPHIYELTRVMDTLREAAKKESDPDGELRVVSGETLLSYRMPQVLQRFRQRAPKVRLSLQSLNCYVIRDALLNDEADVGVFYRVGNDDALNRRELGEQSLVLVASPQIKDVDLTQYADKLIARFANPALKHKTWQIAMDGSQKLPQRMLAGIRIHLGRETDWSLLALGVAGWMRYVSGVDDAGNAIDVRDPLSDKIRELVAGSSSEQRVTALLSLREVFGDDLPDNPHFVQAIEQAWQQIVQFGAHQALLNTLKI